MSSLIAIPTGTTRQNSFFSKYVPTEVIYGKTKEKLDVSNTIGEQARGWKTAPDNLHYTFSDKLPLGGRGQSNAVRFVGELS